MYGDPAAGRQFSPGLQLTKASDAEVEEAKDLPYQELIGSLCWIITWVRIEASTIMSMLGQHNARWSKEHFNVALGVLKYLEGSAQKGLRYTKQDSERQQCPGTLKEQFFRVLEQ